MPLRSPPLRFLCSSPPVTRLPQMSLNPLHHPLPTFRRIFPFKIGPQTLGLGFPVTRRLSARAARGRPDSGGGEARVGKSLIEDEDELSDWVSGLRTSSFRSGVVTEDEEDNDRGVKGKRGGGGGGSFGMSRGGRGRGGGDGYNEASESRFGRRGGESDRNGYSSNAGSSRGSSVNSRFGDKRGGLRGGSSRNSGVNPRFGGREGEFGRNRDDSYNGGGYNSRNSSVESRFGGGGERRNGVREGGRGPGGGRMSSRGGRSGGGRGGFVSEVEEVDEEVFGVFESRKGKAHGEEKSTSGFLDLIGEHDSEDDVDVDDDDDDSEGEEIEAKSRSAMFANEGVKSSSVPSSSGTEDSYLSETRFDQCAVSPMSLKAIRDVGYEKMTMVQEATLPVILKGKDVMAKARTGTGKTVAFLLPSIEVVIKTPPAGRDDRRPPILVLVVCPTRELASQAAAEANTLVKYHPSVGVQVVIGGTRLAVEQKRMQANPCQILVATPGRLRDHLENTAGFATRLMGLKVLVLDEADHLLDMGFRKDIEKIVAAVPKQRQTLLFSATIPDEVRQICHIALKRDYEYINTVQEGSGETHAQVRQTHLIAPLENQFPLLYAILRDHISDDVNYKVLVFCTTAMVTKLVADLLGELKLNVREIHSRKPQSYRTRVSDEFRKSKGLILVTSDVSARGVDYPDVTLVIQVGLPSDREQYIHRLGRTGRKGKEGLGILLLAPWEESFLSTIKDLPISKATPPMVDPDVRRKVERALSNVEMKNKEAAYQAWLGYYNSTKTVGRDKTRLVELAIEFSRSMGLDNPPAISKVVLGKMGLKNVPGLRSK
ncbi:hypothetical protein RND81_02G130200 [Saponaria officinalis]|uniref:ATP-dependent RNA helicase n=1 Tax=Saponaria officinalis TaxID=3572 RepID=A0AAW1MU35_SAPOF